MSEDEWEVVVQHLMAHGPVAVRATLYATARAWFRLHGATDSEGEQACDVIYQALQVEERRG